MKGLPTVLHFEGGPQNPILKDFLEKYTNISITDRSSIRKNYVS